MSWHTAPLCQIPLVPDKMEAVFSEFPRFCSFLFSSLFFLPISSLHPPALPALLAFNLCCERAERILSVVRASGTSSLLN